MKLTVLATSDIHGYIRGVDEVSGEAVLNGFARVASYLKKRQQTDKNLILVENGDFLEGSILANSLATRAKEWQIHPFVTLLNQLDYDVAVPGNHEFNYGIKYLDKALTDLASPYLAANVANQEGKPYWQAYQILERSGVKIAILGLVTAYVTRWEKASNIQGLAFLDPVLTAQKWLPKIQAEHQPDLVIIAYHGGLERDLITGEATEYMTGENVGYRLATEVPGVAGVITGHQHRTLAGEVKGVPLLQPGTRGSFIGELTFELVQKNEKWQLISAAAGNIAVNQEPEDPQVLAEIAPWEAKCQADLQRPLVRQKADSVEPAPFAMLHKIQQIASRRKVSAVSLIKPVVGSSNLTMATILANYTFPCTFAILRLTGKEIKELIALGTKHYQLNAAGRLSPFALGSFPPKEVQEELIEGLDYRLDVNSSDCIVELLNLADDELLELSFNHYLSQLNQQRIIGMEKVVQEIMLYMPDLMREYQLATQVAIPVHGQGYYPAIS